MKTFAAFLFVPPFRADVSPRTGVHFKMSTKSLLYLSLYRHRPTGTRPDLKKDDSFNIIVASFMERLHINDVAASAFAKRKTMGVTNHLR